MIKYRLMNWVFNLGAWGRTLREKSDETSAEFIAQVCQVSVKTVENWIAGYETAYGEYPYPSMTNFINVCNQLDLDPRDFFMLEDK